jgi:hypothetical protein
MITLASAMQVDFPDGVVRWVDGGFVVYDSETFKARHPVWGILTGAEDISEGIGDEIPGFRFTCAPSDSATAAVLFNPANNGARVRLWTLELDPITKAVIDDDLAFDGMIGGCRVSIGASINLEFEVVSRAERLFLVNGGNRLDPTFHKSLWPGERGEDNATGLTVNVAWGAPSPTIGGSTSGGGNRDGGIFGGGVFNLK